MSSSTGEWCCTECGSYNAYQEDFSDDEAGEFTAYWLGRPESLFSPFQWTQKFVSHLKQRRLARHSKPVKKIGTQLSTAKSGIEADENARKLVEKYSTKQ